MLLYRSQDLRLWKYLHKLAEGKANGKQSANPCDSGEMWECPDFFPLGDRHCLLYSTEGKVIWTTGHYDAQTHRYTAQHEGVLDRGAYYAPKSFLTPDGRRILWGWIQETRPQAEFEAAGWSGVMSLPRVLGVDAQGRLTMTPAVEVDILRGARIMPATQKNGVWQWNLPALGCELILSASEPTTVRLRTRGTPVWKLRFDPAQGTVNCGELKFSVPASASPSSMRVFLDGSVLETFIGAGEALTSRVYALEPGKTQLEVEASSTSVPMLVALLAISQDRMTH